MQIGNRYIDERYETLKLLDTGGTSQVYLAMDRRMNTQWAIKKVKKRSRAINTIMAEVNTLKNLKHTSLPQIIDIEEDDDFFYVVMDYIRGENLRTILKVDGPQDQDTVVKWGIKLCDVISYLHDHGIIYRDMKPSNIMLTPEDEIVLIDFGIARNFDPNTDEDTISLGTEGYAAPEQYEGNGQTDARTDIYGIGVTLFHLLTDIKPASHSENTFSIRLANPSLSSGLDRIILKCTNKDRKMRYQSAQQLKQALLHYRDLDNDNLRKNKKATHLKRIFFVLSAICFIASGVFFVLDMNKTGNKYESLISDTQNKDRIKDAIELIPQDPRGYTVLLDYYGEEFDQDEAAEFSHVFSEHQSEINNKSEVAMKAGEKILSSYSENSLRGKLLVAEPYFSAVDKDYESYPAAEAYVNMAAFYKDYVMQGDGSIVKEASKKEYTKLLGDMSTVLESVSEYKGTEQKNLYLTAAELCIGLISEQAQPMKEQGVAQADLQNILAGIRSEAESLDPKIEVTRMKKEKVIEMTDKASTDLKAVYKDRAEDTVKTERKDGSDA